MIFTEPVFFAFLTAVLTAYWLLRCRDHRLDLLLAASALFYGWWDWRFLGLIALVVLITWIAGREAASRPAGDRVRRRWLAGAIAINLGVLASFKYFGFFTESALRLAEAAGLQLSWPTVNLLLPVGISFYVFQAISYLVDVARGDLAPERRLRRLALYIGFFPQLVAGPIVRAASFFPQMARDKRLSGALIASGVRLFILGFIYKAGVADNLAPFIDPVFGDPMRPGDSDLAAWSNGALIGATLAFAAQIYFDFAGYSLMAIGVARLFGFHIPRNFDTPYAARSIADFWRRWHISLSSWLRDYVYIPLGGSRGRAGQTARNLMVTMLLGGLWHGAAWTFVAWGALHGAALVIQRHLLRTGGRTLGPLAALLATQLFVLLAWVPFRADGFSDTLDVWSAFAGLRAGGPGSLPAVVLAVPLLILADMLMARADVRRLARRPVLRHPLVYGSAAGALAALALALYPLEAAPFVYFQF